MEDELDFTKPLGSTPQPPQAAAAAAATAASAPFKAAQSRFYDAAVAAAVFRKAGKEERFTAGQAVFAEDDAAKGLFKSTRMYYLAEGEVALSIGGKPLDIVKAGEIFGEMAVITGRPRSASAAAKANCLAYSMDAKELQAAVGANPEFALMLASIMYDRLRFLAARLAQRPKTPGTSQPLQAAVFEPMLVAELEAALPRTARMTYQSQSMIFKEGQVGTLMYVVKTGRVGIAIGGEIVEVAGPGATFGEMAVVDQSPRTARAGAIEYTELLAIDRATLLVLIKGNPAFAMALLRAVSERLRHMNAQFK